MGLRSWLHRMTASDDRYVDDWLKGLERGLVTATGIDVTVPAALTAPGISACIQVQAEDLAKVPLELKLRTDTGYQPAENHPLYNLLKYGPAPWLSSYRWRVAMAHAVMAYGNHYSRVWRAGSGRVDYLSPLATGRTTVRWADDGEPYFDLTMSPGGQQERGLSWQDVIHVGYRDSHDLTPNGGIMGVSPIMQNRETVALMLAAERFAGYFFANGMQPSVVLEYDKKLPDDEVAKRMRAGIERVYGGLDNKWKVAILELGVKLKEFSSDPTKSQLIETRKLAAEQACTMYRTPPHKIGILDKATFSNIEQQSIDYVTGPISAMARSVEDAITIACLTPDERVLLKVEHNLEGLMRGDLLSRYRSYAIGRQWGWLSVNDVLRRENENEIGPDGDAYLVPSNMLPADRAGDQLDQPAPSQNTPPAGAMRWFPLYNYEPKKLNGHVLNSHGEPIH